jgi:uncharacterized membrane protein YgaE (UPF0421/DUF939 family)
MLIKLIFPIFFATVFYFGALDLGAELNSTTTFLLAALGIVLGVLLNIYLFKKE